MKTNLIALGIFGLMTSISAHAEPKGVVLQCDDNSIFETPLMMRVNQNTATASGSFSGSGGAIFDIHDSHLSVLHQPKGSLAISGNQFLLKLHRADAASPNAYAGHLRARSTDGEYMPYAGQVSCKVIFKSEQNRR